MNSLQFRRHYQLPSHDKGLIREGFDVFIPLPARYSRRIVRSSYASLTCKLGEVPRQSACNILRRGTDAGRYPLPAKEKLDCLLRRAGSGAGLQLRAQLLPCQH